MKALNKSSIGPVIWIDDKKKSKLNHMAFAHAFVENLDIHWCTETKTFHAHDERDHIFKPLPPDGAKDLLGAFITEVAKEVNVTQEHLNITDAKLESVLKLARSIDPLRPANHLGCLPVQNGVVYFGSRQVSLVPNIRKYGFRYVMPFEYHKDAECPMFEAMVERVLPDPHDRRVFQMYLGAPLTGLNCTRRMLVMKGPTGTSKSTILKIQETILSPKMVADLRAGLLGSRFEKSFLLEKQQLSAKDVPANFLQSQGAKSLKHLVGGDGTEAEIKGGGKAQIHGNFFVVITANGELRIALEGDESAWAERLIVLDFTGGKAKKSKADYAAALLKEEGNGIFRWLCDGGMAYLKEVRAHGDIRLSAAQRLRVDNMVLASKSLEVFVSSKLAYLEGQDMTNDEIIRAYSVFCKERGWEPVSSHVLYSRLPDLVLHKLGASKASDVIRNGARHKGYRNLILLPR